MLEIMDRIAVELQQTLPDISLVMELNNELMRIQIARMNKMAGDITLNGKTDVLGEDPAAQTAEFQVRADRIKKLAAAKVAQINALTALVLAINRNSGGAQPPAPPIDSKKNDEDDGDMLKRIEKLESDVAAIKIDVAVIKANGATKSDLADLRGALTKDFTEVKGSFGELRAAARADIADAKTAIILWVVGAIFVAQILPAILKAIPELMAIFGK